MITKSRFRSIAFLIVLVLAISGTVTFLVISNWRVSQKRAELRAKTEELQKEIQFLEEKKKQLEAGVYQVGQEEFLEEKIREQGYSKPGEEAVVIKKEPEENENKAEVESGFWEKVFNIFKRD